MDSRSIHSSRGGGHGGNGGMPGIPGMGIQQPPGGPGGPPHPPPHHHLSHHHPPPGQHYDDRDRMSAHSGPVGRLHRPSPPLADPYYAHHHQQPPPHHQQHHQQHPSHHQQHPQPPHHAQHTHQPPPHHGPHPAHAIQQPTRHYKEHSRSPEAERIPQTYRSQTQQRNESLTPLNITSRSPVGPPPMYSVPRASTPDQQHPSSRAPSLTGSPAVYRPPSHHPPPPPPPPPPSHTPHHPHPPHHQMGPESMMNPPPHHRSMLPPSSPHRNTPPLQQQPPPPLPPQHQGPHQKQGRQPTPSSNHPGPSTPFSGNRDLPSLNNGPSAPPQPPQRQTSGMSISAMLDGPAQPSQTGPPKPPPPQPDYNPSKRPYTPDFAHQNGDRSRNVSIGSSPGVMSNQHQGYGSTGAKGRATPDTYRSHLPHGPPGIMANHPHVPPRPVSQPVAPSAPHSLSSVFRQHQDEGPHRGHARSASYHDRESMRPTERERERERERSERERERYELEQREKEEMRLRYEREMQEREERERLQREREMREMREREMREREMREREREREMREREMREIREREMREREMREREMREREMHEMRERELRELRDRDMRDREMRDREMMERDSREMMMERDRERDRERGGLAAIHMGPSSPHVNHHPQPHGPPAYHTHPLTNNSNTHPSMTSAVPPPSQLPPPPPGPPHTPMVSGITTLPPQQPLNQNHGPPPPPPPTSSSYPSFGYTTVMPPSPFALQPTPSLPPPPPGEGHDRRRQGYADNQHGRAEELLYSKQMSERKAAAQSVAQAQIDRKNPLLAMSGYDMDGIGGQAVSKRGISEKEEKEDNLGGSRGRTKEKMEKERETEEEGAPSSVVSAGPGKKRRVHHHHHPPHHHPHHHHPHPHHSHDNDERFPLDGGPLHPQSQSTVQSSGKRAMTPIPVHHHYPPRHHSPAPQPPAKRPKLIINSTPVVASVANFPRYHLGSMVYNPSGNANGSNKGYSTTHSMLPRFEGRENCIFQIRIPRRYLYERERAEICRKRSLWGSDVYTDDSDVLAVLVHLGKIPPTLPEGIEPEMVLGSPAGAIEERDKEIGRKAGRIGGKGKAVVNGAWHNSASATTSADKINGATSNPASGATINSGYLDINKDIIVDILILPPLEKYSSTVRNAIRSRSWTSQHDGMSYMVHEVKTAEPGEAEGRGKSMRKQRLNEREHIRKWGTLPGREGEGGLRSLVGREAKVGA